jgi:CRISPR/Cas system CMR-associated protein Cmr1 (group 7 of RAMP superfamily)
MAARLAIARAQRQLSQEAGVHLHVRNFEVINTVRSQLKPLMMFCGLGDTHTHDAARPN